jgi:chromosome segregation ATPase
MFQELKEVYEEKIMKLETTIDCLKSEIETEHIMKEEVEKHIEELTDELENVEHEMDELKADHVNKLNQIQEKYSVQLKLLEKKSEKLAAENFEYAVENVNCLIV